MTPAAIEGRGALHAAVLEAAPASLQAWSWRRTHGRSETGLLVLSVHDHPDGRRDRRLHRRFADRGFEWLAVRGEPGRVWVGPLAGGPGGPGCLACLAVRLRAGGSQAAGPSPPCGPRAGALVLRLAVAWRRLEASAGLAPGMRLVVELEPSGTARPGGLAPVPGCPCCGGPPPASGLELGAAELAGVPRTGDLPADLLARVVDERIGIVCRAGSVPGGASGPATGVACAPSQDLLAQRRRRLEWGLGSGDTEEEAGAVAILEALERYSGRARGRTLTHAAASDLGGRCIDPRRLVLHDDEQYGRPGFGCQPFDPDVARDWTWAYSLGEARHLAVPADLVFYQRRRPAAAAALPLAHGSSSGCAIAREPARAALNALLEVLERDALLQAWHAGLPPPQLDVEAASDPRIRLLRAQLDARGYDVLVLDTTPPDHRVPCVWAVAVARAGDGLKMLSGASCHPDPELAVLRAMREVASHLTRMRDLYASGGRRRALRALAGTPPLRRPRDHVMLYALPEAFDRLRFLMEGERRPLAVGAGAHDAWPAVCAAVRAAGFDILVADMTSIDLRPMGLTAVRVLVPGTLPMTFGRGNERFAGARWPRARPASVLPHPFG